MIRIVTGCQMMADLHSAINIIADKQKPRAIQICTETSTFHISAYYQCKLRRHYKLISCKIHPRLSHGFVLMPKQPQQQLQNTKILFSFVNTTFWISLIFCADRLSSLFLQIKHSSIGRIGGVFDKDIEIISF